MSEDHVGSEDLGRTDLISDVRVELATIQLDADSRRRKKAPRPEDGQLGELPPKEVRDILTRAYAELVRDSPLRGIGPAGTTTISRTMGRFLCKVFKRYLDEDLKMEVAFGLVARPGARRIAPEMGREIALTVLRACVAQSEIPDDVAYDIEIGALDVREDLKRGRSALLEIFGEYKRDALMLLNAERGREGRSPPFTDAEHGFICSKLFPESKQLEEFFRKEPAPGNSA